MEILRDSSNMFGSYFFLKHNCRLEFGLKGAAIYDLVNEKVFAIDLYIGRLINSCKQGIRLEKLLNKIDTVRKQEIKEYLYELKKKELGFFSNNYVVIENLSPLWTIFFKTDPRKSFDLNEISFEITKLCNLDCIHCREKNGAIAKCSCSSNRNAKTNDNKVSLELWIKTVYDAYILKCKKLNIIGGEPFLSKQKLIEIIKYAFNKIPTIKIKSNLLLIDEKFYKILKKYQVIIESNFYSHNYKIHDKITHCQGSWKKWLSKCKELLNEGIKINVIIEVLNINKNHVRETKKFLFDIGINSVSSRLIYSYNKKIWPDSTYQFFLKRENSIHGVSKDQYYFNKNRNSCWYGKIAISVDGNIQPCIMASNYTMGNIFKKSLLDVIRENQQMKYWTLTKDKINKCKDCEFRYACFECRPIESKSKNINSENRFCEIY